jgi:uncharacterized membrane protein
MPSKLVIALIASLAINAALLGVVGGQLANKQRVPRPEFTGARPPSPPPSDVQAAWAQLSEADRAELRKQFQERWVTLESDRKALAAAGKSVHDVAMAEPFDEVKLRDALTIYQWRQERMQRSAEDILISHLGKMTPEARATAAAGLLTPFNQRIQRAGDGKRNGDGKKDVTKRGDGKQPGPPVGAGPQPSSSAGDEREKPAPGSPS